MKKAPPILARVFRGTRVESAHRGSIAVADETGTVLAGCGDWSAPVFARSTAKPFQAIPLLAAGGDRKLRLGDAEIALLCGSHGGEPRHVKVAMQLLRRGGLGIEDLHCGPDLPTHEPSARELARAGRAPTRLHNNCSGKHAGLLLACRLLELPTETYTELAHPLERRIRSLLAGYAGLPEAEIGAAVDGCSAPAFRLPLSGLAVAYARLAASRIECEERPAAAARARLWRAMTRRPEMVAGERRFTTDFIAAGRGRWIGKEGAEGVYAMALRPGAGNRRAIGIAFKIEDGSARPRDAVALQVLDRLGELAAPVRRALAPYAEPVILNAAGVEIGRLEADPPIVAMARPSRARARGRSARRRA
jgi:L-asparaginase II